MNVIEFRSRQTRPLESGHNINSKECKTCTESIKEIQEIINALINEVKKLIAQEEKRVLKHRTLGEVV